MFDFDAAARLLEAEFAAIEAEYNMVEARLAFARIAARKVEAKAELGLEPAGPDEGGRHGLHS
jgi:hypothetical protein